MKNNFELILEGLRSDLISCFGRKSYKKISDTNPSVAKEFLKKGLIKKDGKNYVLTSDGETAVSDAKGDFDDRD